MVIRDFYFLLFYGAWKSVENEIAFSVSQLFLSIIVKWIFVFVAVEIGHFNYHRDSLHGNSFLCLQG